MMAPSSHLQEDWQESRQGIRRIALVLGALALAVLLANAPALRAGFIWDDPAHVEENMTLRTAEGLGRIWFERGAVPQYYPLVHTTFWIEWRLFGLDARGYHATNVLLQALVACLVYLAARRLRLPGALLLAAMFGLHPVHVETTAWISERKNLLSGAFYLGSLLAYLRFRPPDGGPGASGARRFYVLSAALFLAALLSKTVTASLPAVILLLVWWRRGRIGRSDVVPLLPFFVAGFALGLQTAYVEVYDLGGTGRGASGEEWDLSLPERFLVAGRAIWFYLEKLAWPRELCFIYPRFEPDAASLAQWLFPLGALGLALALVPGALASRRIGRGPLTAFLFFAGTLFPALGFINVYPFRYSFFADHFQYLASLGPLALAAALLARLTRARPKIEPATAAALALVLGPLTFLRASDFRDEEILWRDTLDKNPACWMAHNNLGAHLAAEGRDEEALVHFRAALAMGPEDARNHANIGNVLLKLGRTDEAVAELRAAVAADETAEPSPYTGLGVALAMRGEIGEAERCWRRALELFPSDATAAVNLAKILVARGQREQAIGLLERTLPRAPDAPILLVELAEMVLDAGRHEEATGLLERALKLDPANDDARRLLATARWRSAPPAPGPAGD